MFRWITAFGWIFTCVLILAAGSTTQAASYDVVIYAGTPGGIAAAIQTARMGRSVVLIEPGKHLGGLSSGGLGHTDKGKAETIGGISREFYQRVGKHYGRKIAWQFEPHVAEQTFNDMIAEAGPGKITIVLGQRLDRSGKGLRMANGRITAMVTESGDVYEGRVFIDASYEGDLMAEAGVTYHVGRESRDEYGEPLAGVLEPGKGKYRQPKVFFGEGVDPYVKPGDPSSGLLAGIQDVPLGEIGSGDKKIQAYNFRICLTTDPANRIDLTEPKNYDPARYELLARFIAAQPAVRLTKNGKGWRLLTITPMPNHKTDINDGCPFSTDYIGANWDYPEGDYATRQRIFDDHVDFTKGLLWFLASDPRVPEHVRTEMKRYGYPRDEYVDSDHFSTQMYIREARRMIGPYVMIQSDCDGSVKQRSKPDPVGIGSYGVDSHHIQRVVYNGQVVNEGNFLAHHSPYQIPYRSIIPKKDQCTNLLVPVCVSSSHIAFGSIRMEPVYMILGQSAGTAAVMAIEAGDAALQDVPYPALRKRLEANGQVLEFQ
ncbi:FAD-dependent oxidoreductase [Planctomycetales bacterium ZRK34]|nr:FAD-dependent oxidoreductase [Planctomycetales bacterium ZRK34]